MSTPASPLHEDAPLVDDVQDTPLVNGSPKTTRTVAIIKPHALQHRFDIEHRISEAGFEIAKERQMEIDTETDPETLLELFGEDYVSFAEGPVWVYVLERRRAVEVWHTVMGDEDPEIARQETPNSIRALYGISKEQNAVMGSPDGPTAEIQVLSIFASSPPFPPTELPDVDSVTGGSLRSVSSAVLEALRQGSEINGNGYAASSTTNTSTINGDGEMRNRKSSFKARPLPVTHDKPDIVPRMSKAAALRAGIVLDGPKRVVATKESLAKTFANVPGHKRAEAIPVASTAPPTIAPRMTRAASLRLGQKPAPKPTRPRASTADGDVTNGATVKKTAAETFEGVPGHKRRESISVASTKAPTVAPRLNKSAALRVQKDSAPPTSFMFRAPSNGMHSRSSSRTSMHEPARSSSRTNLTRPASAASARTNSFDRPPLISRASSNGADKALPPKPTSASAATPTPAKPKPRPSSLQAPTIAPRPNKSALLRAQKMAAETAAAAAKSVPGKKMAPRPSVVANRI